MTVEPPGSVETQLLELRDEAIVIQRPVSRQVEQHLCLDKGYDNPSSRGAAKVPGYVSHIRRIGEEKLDSQGSRRLPVRRWVVERTLAWLSMCRAILVRYDKKPVNYLGLLHLAYALVWYRQLRRVEVGVPRGLLVDGVSDTADFGLSASNTFCPAPFSRNQSSDVSTACFRRLREATQFPETAEAVSVLDF